MKKIFFTIVLTIFFTGCVGGAGSQFSTASSSANSTPFNVGVSIGQAIGKSLWGGK